MFPKCVCISVFPAEACDIIGGEACDVEMYPEAKLTPDIKSCQTRIVSEETVDREYLDYNTPKTYKLPFLFLKPTQIGFLLNYITINISWQI